MITITVRETQEWNSDKRIFVKVPETTVSFEHSLRSMFKWEGIYKKPFLTQTQKTPDEMLDYFKCMALEEVDRNTLLAMTKDQVQALLEYIGSNRSATWFSEREPQKGSRKVLTAEVIYSYMSAFGIDWQAQDWHLSRLMTLIRICDEQNKPQKKMSASAAALQQRALNAERRQRLHSKG